MKTFENIIFDLGGVIINLDYNRTAQAFIDLGLKNFNEIYSKAQQYHLFDDFEKGIMPPENFRAELRKYLHSETTDEQIDKAWKILGVVLAFAALVAAIGVVTGKSWGVPAIIAVGSSTCSPDRRCPPTC